jgi:exopolyphosphatase/guanosine-5'-triphosphate,3'-diphosphate pyrophosphatase
MSPADVVAAIDLGSNSFHLVVARVTDGDVRVIDQLRDRVGLAEGLGDDHVLSAAVEARAFASLERLGQRVRHMRPGSVRAVGTNALRQARGSQAFLARASELLGHPVEVVAGREEARLIYLGVAHTLADDGGRRLVVDIGGGSTECIVGERFEPIRADSLYMGCVSWSQQFFPGGKVTADRFERAKTAARLELEPIERAFQASGWTRAIGSSGTILAVEALARTLGEDGLTRKGLKRVVDVVLQAAKADDLVRLGVTADRAPVLPGGLAILTAVFDGLGVQAMTTSTGALREGVIYDLLGRIRHEDVRHRTIGMMASAWQVDRIHAQRVELTARALFDQVAGAWALGDDDRQVLGWAARLHEIGQAVAYTGYHKHGAYLVGHAEMPGFSREDQARLAALVGLHRRRLRQESLDALAGSQQDGVRRLAVLLRLAVRLHRSRAPGEPVRPRIGVAGDRVTMEFEPGWLGEHPLTAADLDEEAGLLAEGGVKLVIAG